MMEEDLELFKQREAMEKALSDEAVREHARTVARSGPNDYPGDTFRETFGEDIHVLASVAGTGRFARFLREEGFEIPLKIFPEGKHGCQVTPVKRN